jgi:hypothetical protein
LRAFLARNGHPIGPYLRASTLESAVVCRGIQFHLAAVIAATPAANPSVHFAT